MLSAQSCQVMSVSSALQAGGTPLLPPQRFPTSRQSNAVRGARRSGTGRGLSPGPPLTSPASAPSCRVGPRAERGGRRGRPGGAAEPGRRRRRRWPRSSGPERVGLPLGSARPAAARRPGGSLRSAGAGRGSAGGCLSRGKGF